MNRALSTAAALVSWVVGDACVARRPPRADYGVPPCPPTAAEALLSADALQCWFDARHGRWRILSHVAFHDALVVDIETENLRDADEIARRFTAAESDLFSEILIYAQSDSRTPPSTVRRVRWTRSGGFDVLEFSGPGRS